jgi:hypothetical protein
LLLNPSLYPQLLLGYNSINSNINLNERNNNINNNKDLQNSNNLLHNDNEIKQNKEETVNLLGVKEESQVQNESNTKLERKNSSLKDNLPKINLQVYFINSDSSNVKSWRGK